MSLLISVLSLLSFFSGFDPLFKESIQDRVEQLDVCAGNGCAK